MITNGSKTYELLGEIAKLLKKYDKSTFIELAKIIKDPNLANHIAETLEAVAQTAPQKKITRKHPSLLEEGMRVRESLASLGNSEPEKSKILLLIFDSLKNKKILPSLRELANFISDQGLPVPKTKSRDKAINSFLKKCTELPLHELEGLIATTNRQQHLDSSDRSLEGWGKIILDRKDR